MVVSFYVLLRIETVRERGDNNWSDVTEPRAALKAVEQSCHVT